MHLAFHCAQRSFAATILNQKNSEIIYQRVIEYDTDLPHRDTVNGHLYDSATNQTYIDPQMLVETLDLLFEWIHEDNLDIIPEIKMISGTAAPAVIFLNLPLSEIALNPSLALNDQLRPYYSSRKSPTSNDLSATDSAKQIKQELQLESSIGQITGTPNTSQTTAAQIKKLATEQTHLWHNTTSIHTTGSFLCSILTGANSPLDITDSSQLGIVDLKSRKYRPEILEYLAPDLAQKLPKLVETPHFSGNISDYFQHKYGFSATTRCLAWISEDAARTLGSGSLSSSEASLALNDSYLLAINIKKVPADIPYYSRVTIHPLYGFTAHISLSNGIECLRHIADLLGIDHSEINWHLDEINSITNDPHLPFLQQELSINTPSIDFKDATILSVAIGQLLHLKLFSQWVDQPLGSLTITGCGAKFAAIGKLCADIYQVPCYTIRCENIISTGTTILEEIYLDIPFKDIKLRHHTEAFTEIRRPEPYMANFYNQSMNRYHTLLTQHTSH